MTHTRTRARGGVTHLGRFLHPKKGRGMLQPFAADSRRECRRPTALQAPRDSAAQKGAIMGRRRGFSWKRALGVTKAKRDFARATGIPTSRASIKRKLKRKAAKGAGCSTLMLIVAISMIAASAAVSSG